MSAPIRIGNVHDVDRDLELLERWRQGDQVAGNDLFQRHFASIRRFFRTKVSLECVEDLVQRTLAGCVESVSRFSGDATFRTYLFSIARRQLYKHLRESASRSSRHDVDMRVSSVRDLGQSPSSAAAARETKDHVQAALQSIATEYQLVLELYYWEQMTGPQIAEILEVSPVTVRTRLHRARAALKEAMASRPHPAARAAAADIEVAMRRGPEPS